MSTAKFVTLAASTADKLHVYHSAEPTNSSSGAASNGRPPQHPRLCSILRANSGSSCGSNSSCGSGASRLRQDSDDSGVGDNGSTSMMRLVGNSSATDCGKSSPAGSSVNFDTSSATGNTAPLPANPVLPLFAQLNVRFAAENGGDQAWKEASR